jgi:hypothetical protein
LVQIPHKQTHSKQLFFWVRRKSFQGNSMEIWSKLKVLKGSAAQFKSILVNNAPKSFDPVVNALKGLCEVKTSLKGGKDTTTVPFVLSFVQSKSEISQQAQVLNSWVGAAKDCAVWFAYPKKSSKKYKSDVNRDDGFQPLGAAGFEPVSIISIDDDWSALRFRRVAFIETMTRATALTAEGEQKIQESRKRGITCGTTAPAAGPTKAEKGAKASKPTKATKASVVEEPSLADESESRRTKKARAK